MAESRPLSSAPGSVSFVRPTGQWNWIASAGCGSGADIEYAVPGSSWTAKLEYDYVVMANRKFVVSVPNVVTVSPNLQILKVGMNFRM